jgi:hypothetical protein
VRFLHSANDWSVHLPKPIKRRYLDAKGSRDLGSRFAFQNKSSSQLFLIQTQFSPTIESESSFSSSFSLRTCFALVSDLAQIPLCQLYRVELKSDSHTALYSLPATSWMVFAAEILALKFKLS